MPGASPRGTLLRRGVGVLQMAGASPRGMGMRRRYMFAPEKQVCSVGNVVPDVPHVCSWVIYCRDMVEAC